MGHEGIGIITKKKKKKKHGGDPPLDDVIPGKQSILMGAQKCGLLVPFVLFPGSHHIQGDNRVLDSLRIRIVEILLLPL